MCGFAGSLGGEPLGDETMGAMAAALAHRGPDDEGSWSDRDARIALVHRRLAILDLSASGHQPMASADGRYVIAFNGEIYNHLELRAELERSRQAPEWRGHSDTETLLAGFLAWDIAATVRKARGMFAFAVWDRQGRALTLARDRLGEKPLYYGWTGSTFLFGSELKALRAHPAFAASIDRVSLAAFMRLSYVPAPRSIYGGISKLTPGTLLTVRNDGRTLPPVEYWSLLDVARRGLAAPFTGTEREALTLLETSLAEAVKAQQLADVPLGAFLSGGVDSSTIVALMQAGSMRAVQTFTIGFDIESYNEADDAKAVARHLGTDHTELYASAERAREVIPLLPTLYDEPFGDSSQIPTFLVSQLARRTVTVSLSGDAGDELFGGYNRYVWGTKLLRYPQFLRKWFATGLTTLPPAQWDALCATLRRLRPLLRCVTPGDRAHKLAAVLSAPTDAAVYGRLVSAWTDPGTLVVGAEDATDVAGAWEQLGEFGAAENKMMALDTLGYLPDDILCKVDRAAMAVSLETRVPFLDHRVVELAWRLPLQLKIRSGERYGKWILRQLLYKYVPRSLVDRPKMGFGLPIDVWLRGPLREWAEQLLGETRLRQEGFLDPAPIRRKWAEHLSGRRNWQQQLWNVLMFQAWLTEQRL